MGIEVKEIDYMNRMLRIRDRNMFTDGVEFDSYITGICRRYARVYGEILDRSDYRGMIEKLESKGCILYY